MKPEREGTSMRYVRTLLAVVVLFGLGLGFSYFQSATAADGQAVTFRSLLPGSADEEAGNCFDDYDDDALMADMIGRTAEGGDAAASGSGFASGHAGQDGESPQPGSDVQRQESAPSPESGSAPQERPSDSESGGDDDTDDDEVVECPRTRASSPTHPVPRTPEGD